MLLGLLAGLARGPWTVIGQLRFVCPGLRRLWEGTHVILAPPPASLSLPHPSNTPHMHPWPACAQASVFAGLAVPWGRGRGEWHLEEDSRVLSLCDQLGDSTEQPVIQEGLASTPGVDGFSECRTPRPGLRRDLIIHFFFF